MMPGQLVVTAKRAGESRVHHLTVPADLPAVALARVLASRCGWGSEVRGRIATYELEVDPPGRVLRRDETLADAGCTDGVWIVARLADPDALSPAPPHSPPASATPGQPAEYRWRRIDRDEDRPDALPQGSRVGARPEPPSPATTLPGYIWRRIDADDD